MASEPQRHSLTSTTLVVLPEEHQHEYEAILDGFRESWKPQDATEEALVVRLAQAHWRSLRSRRIETGILQITATTERNRARKVVEDCPENLNPHNAIAVSFMTRPEERWKMYLRYDGAISREFFRTLDTLTRLQKARQPKKPSQEPVMAAAAGTMSDFGIRSVLQMSAEPAHLTEEKELTHDWRQHPNTKRRDGPNSEPVRNFDVDNLVTSPNQSQHTQLNYEWSKYDTEPQAAVELCSNGYYSGWDEPASAGRNPTTIPLLRVRQITGRHDSTEEGFSARSIGRAFETDRACQPEGQRDCDASSGPGAGNGEAMR